MADGSIHIDTKLDESGLKSGIAKMQGTVASGADKVGSAIKAGLTAATAAFGSAAAGVGVLTKAIVANYAEYEQLVGGVDTLFKTSSGMLMDYASNAWKTAGLSANQYMTTATSFAASLLQSLKNDTVKAAEVTEMAITDMSDNANKMGTDMAMIQNAYQGFAKQNYTMLDNLKLGYGGTKEEMKRLLADAQKLTGVKYDITNLNDVYQAIHVIQTELGITGTTAKEASTTISGSANAMKAAWSNMMVGMADDSQNFDQLLDNLLYSIEVFAGNIIPRVETSLMGVATLIDRLAPIIIERLPGLASTLLPQLLKTAGSIVGALASAMPGMLQAIITTVQAVGPQLISQGVNLLASVAQGMQKGLPNFVGQFEKIISGIGNVVSKNLPSIIKSGISILSSLTQGIIKSIPSITKVGVQIISSLTKSVNTGSGDFIKKALDLVEEFADKLIDNVPKILAAGLDLMKSLVQGIANGLPTLIQRVPGIISKFASVINDNAPTVLKAGWDMLVTLGKGIINAIPTLVKNIPQIFKAIWDVWQAINWLQLGTKVITGLVNGIKSLFGSVGSVAKSLGDKLTSVFTALPNKFLDIGKNIISGLWNGIKNAFSSLTSKVTGLFSGLVSSIKSSLGIHSPSTLFRDVVGKNIGLGVKVGIDRTQPDISRAMSNLVDPGKAVSRVSRMKASVGDHVSGMTFSAATKALSSAASVNNPKSPTADAIAKAIWDKAPPMVVDLDGNKVGEIIEPRVSDIQAEKAESMNRRNGFVFA